MEEGGCNSWVRRAKFSHTVCHRLGNSRIPTIPFGLLPLPDAPAKPPKPLNKPRGGDPGANESVAFAGDGCNELRSMSRSASPLPYSLQLSRASTPTPRSAKVPDTFKEARLEAKRFSTPTPRRRRGSELGLRGKLARGGGGATATEIATAANEAAALGASTRRSQRGRVNAVQMTEEHAVELSQLYIGTRFATGAYSRLYRGLYEDQAVAVKVISQPVDEDNASIAKQLEKQFKREVAILSRLCHRNVLKLVGSCSKPPSFIIITDYLSGGCLRAFLHKLERKSLPLKQMISIALDVARGMEYIHSQGVFHCDLKPENILFDQDFCVKIADFGIACEEARYDALAGDPGTYRWMAPEMIKRKKYGRKVDVYSFGLILWEMMTGRIPYEDLTPVQAAFAVVNKDLRPNIPPGCPLPLRALIEQCWVLHPEKRPEFWQIVKVLEQFESALSRDGTLDQVQNLTFQEHKKWLLHWIQKLKPKQLDRFGQPVPRLL